MPIFQATPEHFENILTISEYWDREEDNQNPTDPDKIKSYIDDGMVFLFTEEDDDEILGVMIYSDNYTYYNLYTLYVQPDYRNQGIGPEMMSHFTKMLDGRAMSAFLEVDAVSPAIDLYERHGFHKADKFDTIPEHIAMTREPS